MRTTFLRFTFSIVILFGGLFISAPVFIVQADAVGGAVTVLSFHSNPGELALREQYPRRLDDRGYVAITPGLETYYEQSLVPNVAKVDFLRYGVGAGYDCADLKAGYVHWGGRWVFPWKDRFHFSLGLGPTLIFRESWTKRFPGLVDDEQGFWTESETFLPGYQHKWLLGGNIDMQYQINSNWQAVWSVVPAVVIVVVNSLGVRYSF